MLRSEESVLQQRIREARQLEEKRRAAAKAQAQAQVKPEVSLGAGWAPLSLRGWRLAHVLALAMPQGLWSRQATLARIELLL